MKFTVYDTQYSFTRLSVSFAFHVGSEHEGNTKQTLKMQRLFHLGALFTWYRVLQFDIICLVFCFSDDQQQDNILVSTTNGSGGQHLEMTIMFIIMLGCLLEYKQSRKQNLGLSDTSCFIYSWGRLQCWSGQAHTEDSLCYYHMCYADLSL